MYDVVVIGGGPGGYAAAIRAAQLGGKVALAEADQIGGTCVNRGCIPSKVWQRSARMLQHIQTARDFGIKARFEGLDLKAVVERINGVAGDIRMGMESLLKNNAVELVPGRAVIKSPREVAVDKTRLETRKIIIASGSRLDVPDIAGLEDAALTTDQILETDRIPDSVLIPSAQPIQVELAGTLAVLGCKVTLATPDRRILPREDLETSQRITQALSQQGVDVLRGYEIDSVRSAENGYEAVLTGPDERRIRVERILVCSRRPNTSGAGIEAVGVQQDPDGGIAVNDQLETSVAGIYAVGDVTGGWMLSHAASSMAITAAENAMGQSGAFPFHLIPRCLWTIPQVGSVGLSEAEAEKKGLDVEVGDFPLAINGLAMAHDQMSGAVKIVSEARYGEILGVHIVSEHATELIGEAVLAIQLEATVNELARSIRAHPTFSEAVVDAARDAKDWALYLPPG
jgi:dihydrolipoamide dehydrogenase